MVRETEMVEEDGDIDINNALAPLGDTDRILYVFNFQIMLQGFFLVQCAITNDGRGIGVLFVLAHYKIVLSVRVRIA
jgi:hypothetical protein